MPTDNTPINECSECQKKIEVEHNRDSLQSAHLICAFSSTTQFATQAVRSLLLLNGGGAAAILSFIAATKAPTHPAPLLMHVGLTIFVIGAGLAGAAAVASFACQTCFAQEIKYKWKYLRERDEEKTKTSLRFKRIGQLGLRLSIGFTFISLLAFAGGCGSTFFAFFY